MTAFDLYEIVLTYSAQGESILCNLHKPCSGHPLCLNPSISHLIDFDAVEKKLAIGSRPTLPSCDGVSLSKDLRVFCFIEIKGWKEFISRNINSVNNPLESDYKKVDKQVASYNLKDKLFQSIKDCEAISGQKNLFPSIPSAFILVTDIDSDRDPLEDIASNLSSLAETASIWKYCDETMDELLGDVNTVVTKVYTHCRDFDTVISQLTR